MTVRNIWIISETVKFLEGKEEPNIFPAVTFCSAKGEEKLHPVTADRNLQKNRSISSRADIKDASIFAISPGMIPGYGMGNALELHMQDKQGGDVGTFFNTCLLYTSWMIL